MKSIKGARRRNSKGQYVRVRKNGQHRIDARSSMKAPVGRIIRAQSVNRWIPPGIAVFTPRYVEMILNGALAGDHVNQWRLFDMMLDTWPVLSACQQELVHGVVRRELVFDPYVEEDEKPTDTAIEREKVVTSAIRHMTPDPTRDENALGGMVRDLMDAWFRGISVLEILWNLSDTGKQGELWIPKATVSVDPSYYGFDSDGSLGLAIQPPRPSGYGLTSMPSPRQQNFQPFPPDKFLVAIHKVHSGSPLGGELLRPLAWWWCATNFTSDWLLNLAQVFGLPFRWATYPGASPDQTINALCEMLANMGSAGWAAFPEGSTLELKEPNMATSGNSPQGSLLDRADAYARLLVLGQTLTGQTIASGRGGQAFGTVEAQLKQDRLDAACAFVSEIINLQLIPAILNQNYGEASEAPTCRFLQESQGTYQDSERDQILAGLGLPIPFSHLRDKYNVPEPTGKEETTKPPPKPVTPSAGPPGTRPIGQTPATPSPSQTPRQVQAKFEEISAIENDELFGRELRKFAAELTGELKMSTPTEEPPPRPEPEPPPPPET
jgi:phage gp29-like protein